jgi:Mg/Co/Ni transporter MgtE
MYAILLNLAGVAYVVTQFQSAPAARIEHQEIRSLVDELRANLALSDRALSTRVEAMEQALYGEIAPELKEKQRPVVVASPSANRQVELLRRVEALERWRLIEQGRLDGR